MIEIFLIPNRKELTSKRIRIFCKISTTRADNSVYRRLGIIIVIDILTIVNDFFGLLNDCKVKHCRMTLVNMVMAPKCKISLLTKSNCSTFCTNAYITAMDTYLPYMESGCLDIDSFCRNEVEPMGKECDHVQIAALAKQLGLTVHVEYLDGRVNADNSLRVVSVGAESSEASSESGISDIRKVTLLYRPGHYDILYL